MSAIYSHIHILPTTGGKMQTADLTCGLAKG